MTRFKTGDVRLHHPGTHYHERVRPAAASAFPLVEGQFLDVRDEVGLPDPAAVQFCVGAEIVGLTGVAVTKVVRIVKNEVLVGPATQQARKVCHRKPLRRL